MKGEQGLKMAQLKLRVSTLFTDNDLYVAECPEVGTASQGATIEKAIENLKEATELYLEEFPLDNIPRSLLTTFEVVRA